MAEKKNFKIKIEKKDDSIKILERYKEIIIRTSLTAQEFKKKDVYGSKELTLCLSQLEKLMEIVLRVSILIDQSNKINKEIKEAMKDIKSQLFLIIKSFGTQNISDLLYICFNDKIEIENKFKYNLIEKYFRPIGFKKMISKNTNDQPLIKNRIIEDNMIACSSQQLDCFDLSRTSKSFQTKVYGMKVSFKNEKETLIVCGMVEQVINQCIDDEYINKKYKNLFFQKPKDVEFERKEFNNFINILSLKDYLIYSKTELYNKYIGYINQLKLIKKKTISQVVKEYLSRNLFQQRNTLIILLINDNNSEFQYLAYLLYDLLSNDNNGNID